MCSPLPSPWWPPSSPSPSSSSVYYIVRCQWLPRPANDRSFVGGRQISHRPPLSGRAESSLRVKSRWLRVQKSRESRRKLYSYKATLFLYPCENGWNVLEDFFSSSSSSLQREVRLSREEHLTCDFSLRRRYLIHHHSACRVWRWPRKSLMNICSSNTKYCSAHSTKHFLCQRKKVVCFCVQHQRQSNANI